MPTYDTQPKDNKPLPSQAKQPKQKPAFERIKDSILKNIHSGLWQAGDAIPTEHALATEFGVSRMTVNRALKELSEKRVLYRRQGSGTFVAQQQFNHTVVEVRNIAEHIKSTHKSYKAKVISQQRLSGDAIPEPLLANFYQAMLDENADKVDKDIVTQDTKDMLIDEVKIIHYADDVPVQLEERWVNVNIVPEFIDQDFNVVNTSDYLIQQVPLESGSYTIRALPASNSVADALDIAPQEPALLLSRQTYSIGQVVTFVNMWHAGNAYQFSGTL